MLSEMWIAIKLNLKLREHLAEVVVKDAQVLAK